MSHWTTMVSRVLHLYILMCPPSNCFSLDYMRPSSCLPPILLNEALIGLASLLIWTSNKTQQSFNSLNQRQSYFFPNHPHPCLPRSPPHCKCLWHISVETCKSIRRITILLFFFMSWNVTSKYIHSSLKISNCFWGWMFWESSILKLA